MFANTSVIDDGAANYADIIGAGRRSSRLLGPIAKTIDKGRASKKGQVMRTGFRSHCLREISVSYEAQNELTVVQSPDLSITGMFISTAEVYPEGAVLNLRFRLVMSQAEVKTRCEARHCLPGVGVGVEFIGLGAEAAKIIKRELALNNGGKIRTYKVGKGKKIKKG
jgi:PilZ domain